MTTIAAKQGRSIAARVRLRDELRRRLQRLASSAHIGVAFESRGMQRSWLVACSPDACTVPINAPLLSCKHAAAQRVIRFTLEDLSTCRIVLCSQTSKPASLFDCLQDLAKAIAEIHEVTSREDLLMQELAASWETLATLYESNLDLQSRDSLQNVTDRLLDRSIATGPDVSALLWILDQDEFQVIAERRCRRPSSRTASAGIFGAARERAAPLVIDSSPHELIDDAQAPELQGSGPVALIPVRTRQGLEALLEVWKPANGVPFETPALRLLEAIALQAANAIENDRLYHAGLEGERMRQEMDIGASIQQHLLLGQPPQGLSGVQIANYMLPSLQVGGDFYQFVRHSATCFDAIVGDVMGKGVGAALMGAATKGTLLRVIAECDCGCDVGGLPQPAEIVTATNRDMTGELVQLSSFVTLFYARIDVRKSNLTYVDAGHTHALHYIHKTGAVELLRGEGFPLGFVGSEVYQQSVTPLAAGDIVFIYSDGMSEATDPAGLQFGAERVRDFLLGSALSSASEIATRISDEIAAFRASEDLSDDLTCLVIKIVPKEPGTAERTTQRLTLEGNLDQLEPLREWIAATLRRDAPIAISDDFLFNTQLAIQEVVTNIIFHGLLPNSAQEFTVEIHFECSKMHVDILYEGTPFSRKDQASPSFDGSRDHGFGLFLIDQLMDEVSYTFKQGRNTIRLAKELDRL